MRQGGKNLVNSVVFDKNVCKLLIFVKQCCILETLKTLKPYWVIFITGVNNEK